LGSAGNLRTSNRTVTGWGTKNLSEALLSLTIAPMITHVVLLWVPEGDDEKGEKILAGAAKLAEIPNVLEYRFGKAIPSTRPVVDSSFAVALSMTFPDQAAADAYQSHPLHQKFVNECVKPLTSRVVVYDFE